MLIIHHLGVSQSERVVWLMEKLGLPCEINWHRRGADGFAPASYLALHPAATAPVIQDGDRTLCESAAISSNICATNTQTAGFVQRRERGYARMLEQTLAASAYLAGPELTCADIMVMYGLTSPRIFGGRDDLPNVRSYVKRVSKRPAYIKAMQLAGPTAVPPEGT